MKPLFLSHQSSFLYGGEICTLAFLRELEAQGARAHFAAPAGPYLERAKAWADCHEIPAVQFRRELRTLRTLVPALWRSHRALKKILEGKISLVHATSLKAMVYAAALPVPVLWHHHDILPASLANDLWVRALAARATRILTPSQAGKEALRQSGVPEEKIFVLHNGFALEDWKPRRPRQAGTLRVAMIGEISERKGVDRLLPIAEALPEVRFTVIGAGLSEPEFARSTQRALEAVGVEFLGRREDIPKLLQEIDLLLVLSRQDPLPTVIVEAGLSGVPVIGTRVGGIPEMIGSGGGLLADSTEEIVAALREMQNPEAWARFARAARAQAEAQYDVKKLTRDLLSHYAALGKEGR